jgi:hypothetical protein
VGSEAREVSGWDGGEVCQGGRDVVGVGCRYREEGVVVGAGLSDAATTEHPWTMGEAPSESDLVR